LEQIAGRIAARIQVRSPARTTARISVRLLAYFIPGGRRPINPGISGACGAQIPRKLAFGFTCSFPVRAAARIRVRTTSDFLKFPLVRISQTRNIFKETRVILKMWLFSI
jgi:hypothetical protein